MTGSRVRTCVTTPILDTLHFPVNGPSRHAANWAELPVNDLGPAKWLQQRREISACVEDRVISAHAAAQPVALTPKASALPRPPDRRENLPGKISVQGGA